MTFTRESLVVILWQDARHAIRTLLRSPGFAAVSILTLGLGIGANTAVFGLVNGLLLRTLPVRDPHRLVTISSDFASSRGFTAGVGWNYAMWDRLQQRADAFDGGFAWSTERFNLAERGEIQPVDGVFVSGQFFRVLGIQPLLGRAFTEADDVRGGGGDGPVVVISHGLWQRRFSGAKDVIGSPLLVDGVAFTIVGVTPPDFFGIEVGRVFDVTLPLGTEPLINGRSAAIDQPRRLSLIIVLRLKREQSRDAATATLRTMQSQILGEAPELPPFLKEPLTLTPAGFGTSGATHMPGLRQQYERPLITILIVVGIVLLIACVNLANLVLARASARRHELSVRLALGATTWQLARQLLVESLVLAASGAVVGLMFASWGSAFLAAQLSAMADHVALPLSLDWRVAVFTATVTIATSAMFGLAPALQAARVTPIEALKESGISVQGIAIPRGRGGSRRMMPSRILVIAQLAVSIVLVVVAGLFVRTFERLANVPLGFDRDRVLLVNVETARVRIDPADRHRFYHQLVAALRAVPGVSEAAGSMSTPGGGSAANLMVDARGRAAFPGQLIANVVTPHWFATFGIPLRGGRDLTDRDTAQSPPVVIVNEAFARRFFPGRTAIGHTFVGSDQAFLEGRTAVGIVGDAPYGSLHDPAPPTIYLPLAQAGGVEPPDRTRVVLSARVQTGSPTSLAPGIAAALTAVDRDVAFSFRPLANRVDESLLQERLLAMLCGLLGLLALFLSGLGLYGVTSYAVTRRRAEFGIRMALGAERGDLVWLVLRHNTIVVMTGIALGLTVSAAVTQYLEALLFGVTPLDPWTFVCVSLTFGIVANIAAYLPVRRATRIDPMASLRCDW
jgi:predicted permease